MDKLALNGKKYWLTRNSENLRTREDVCYLIMKFFREYYQFTWINLFVEL